MDHTSAAKAFHSDNPHVYDMLVDLAKEGKKAGADKLGIGQLFEVLRWDRMVSTQSTDFKLNNNFRAWYAREIMENESALSDIFEVRASPETR